MECAKFSRRAMGRDRTLKNSSLRGMGGADFRRHEVGDRAESPGTERYIVCNATKVEPERSKILHHGASAVACD